jgi:hypothetical protein|tara:strand:- start:9676 stop:9909 length:234 start_codon:yes stop_codon:yes gene_type:complete
MNTSNLDGSDIETKYFKITGDSSDSESELSESDTESETESESSSLSGHNGKIKMLRGYLKNTKKYKKILFEDTLFPE